jgi:hypothetical protein
MAICNSLTSWNTGVSSQVDAIYLTWQMKARRKCKNPVGVFKCKFSLPDTHF